jgi:hypothetical protein
LPQVVKSQRRSYRFNFIVKYLKILFFVHPLL